ncbi:MAG: SDR family NAD(P)-dependent oxidoreductase [Alicyclobacillaceae bacterium]|nr:SDR family NAD(P)-dependent oxidoreductase [Alicyclobacillaceae bacterium]
MAARVAFVTSGATGLGHATVRVLLRAGWDVFFTYRSSQRQAEQLLAEAAVLGRSAAYAQADLLQREQVMAALEACHARFQRLDALVHNFGPFVFERLPLADYSDDMWHRMIDGNVTNFVWMYRAVIAGMRDRRFGRIVTVGCDGAGDARGWRHRAAYAAAKAALASLTRSIAREEREYGITANMVCPGDIRGDDKVRLIAEAPQVGGQRSAVGEDVARVIAFLCAEASAQISGTVTEITGGQDILGR